MALTFVGKMNVPNYTALSTDIVGDKITGAIMKGAIVFLTDTAEWKIILDDLTLGDYVLPISFTGNLTIENIGNVGIKQPVSTATAVSPYYGQQDVAVPGTAEALLGSATWAISLTAMAPAGNTGNIYLGTAAVDRTSSQQIILSPGAYAAIEVPVGYKIGVHQWYIDADNGGDGVDFIYLK